MKKKKTTKVCLQSLPDTIHTIPHTHTHTLRYSNEQWNTKICVVSNWLLALISNGKLSNNVLIFHKYSLDVPVLWLPLKNYWLCLLNFPIKNFRKCFCCCSYVFFRFFFRSFFLVSFRFLVRFAIWQRIFCMFKLYVWEIYDRINHARESFLFPHRMIRNLFFFLSLNDMDREHCYSYGIANRNSNW